MYLIIKRGADFTASVLFLIILSPLFLLLAIAIKLESGGAVFFRQERLGRNGKVFRIYKFRSMITGAEKQGAGVYSYKNDPRVTKTGQFIRATSLDELPQLINILKGDMSFIGPRPPLTYHPWPYEEYSDHQKQMFSVRPGITGWAQVNGRKEVPWPQRIELNIDYVHNLSFTTDAKIFFMTVFKVFTMQDNHNIENR